MQNILIVVYLIIILQLKGPSANMDAKALSSAITKFSAKFVKELDKSKSTVSSPLSAKFVLALLTLGTEDPAHGELLTALGIPDDDSIRSSFPSVAAKLKTVKGVILNVANKVYLMDGGYELMPQMEQDAVKVFDAAMEKVNFGKSAEAAKIINTWVEEKTNNKIKNLIKSDDVNEATRLVLVNAIYFKGSWKMKFNVEYTRDQPFYISATKTVNLPMMYKEDRYKYGFSEELGVQYLEMDYEGEEASMLIVLPNEIEGLDAVLEKLAAGYDLMADVENLHKTKVQVTVPKFKIETEIDLNDLLPKLGIKSIFNPKNSGLTKLLNDKQNLYVSKAVQKAFIEVNEEGAEAAAATGMVMKMRCAPRPPAQFIADRPFIYLLLGNLHTTLFFGVYNGK